MIGNLLPSILRTVTPLIVAQLIGWGALSLGVTEDQLTAVATVVVTAAYYGAARLLEEYVSPKFGWLLGFARRPEYPAVEAA